MLLPSSEDEDAYSNVDDVQVTSDNFLRDLLDDLDDIDDINDIDDTRLDDNVMTMEDILGPRMDAGEDEEDEEDDLFYSPVTLTKAAQEKEGEVWGMRVHTLADVTSLEHVACVWNVERESMAIPSLSTLWRRNCCDDDDDDDDEPM